MQTLPVIMSGRDCIACAKTGSGKTLAFTLPMVRHILAQDDLAPGDGPIALILVPTRELAVQVRKTKVASSTQNHIITENYNDI